ncbi:MAG: Phosphotransferase enzyme family protein [candidate division BRC1 bacterium ADurb.BinA364]|nr:MAG: Phosphotransferase enzyme family protein [candidate division BRC1 bacterium ADurb.BinA364]
MNPDRIAPWLRRFVERRLLAPRGMSGSPYRIVEPERGVITFVRLIEVQDAEGFAVRAYPFWRRRQIRRRQVSARIVEQAGLAAPRLADCWRPPVPWAPLFTAEELLAGRHIAPGEWLASEAERFGRALAGWHNIERAAHGPVESNAWRSFAQTLLARARHRLRAVRRRGSPDAGAGELAEAWRWFRAWAPRFARWDAFELTHDKLNPGNLLRLDATGEIAFLDLDTLGFASGAKDLAQAIHDALYDDPAAADAFWQGYLAARPAERVRRAEAFYPFFHAYYHASEAAAALKRKKNLRTPEALDASHAKFLKHWRQALEVMGKPTGQ